MIKGHLTECNDWTGYLSTSRQWSGNEFMCLGEWLCKEGVGYFGLNPFELKPKLLGPQNVPILPLR